MSSPSWYRGLDMFCMASPVNGVEGSSRATRTGGCRRVERQVAGSRPVIETVSAMRAVQLLVGLVFAGLFAASIGGLSGGGHRGPRPAGALASWQSVGGCGAGSTSGAGAGVKWIGRNVTGGLFNAQCQTSYAKLPDGYTYGVS